MFRLQYLGGKSLDLSDEKLVNSFEDYKRKFKSDLIKVILVSSIRVGKLRIIREKERIYLGGFKVLPEYRNRGVGPIIIKNLQKEAVQKRKRIELEVFNNNPKAKALYLRHGFEVDSIEDAVTRMVFIPK